MMKPGVEHLLDFTSASTVGTLELLRFQTDPAGTYYAWKVHLGYLGIKSFFVASSLVAHEWSQVEHLKWPGNSHWQELQECDGLLGEEVPWPAMVLEVGFQRPVRASSVLPRIGIQLLLCLCCLDSARCPFVYFAFFAPDLKCVHPRYLIILRVDLPLQNFNGFLLEPKLNLSPARYKEDLDEDSAERLLPLVMAECMADWMGKSHHGGLNPLGNDLWR